MNEQSVLLILIAAAMAATLGMYILKAKKQIQYKGDERWQLIQLKAKNIADSSNSILLLIIVVLPFFADLQTTLSFQRLTTFALIFIGIRNLLESGATIYYDKRL